MWYIIGLGHAFHKMGNLRFARDLGVREGMANVCHGRNQRNAPQGEIKFQMQYSLILLSGFNLVWVRFTHGAPGIIL